MQQIIQRFYKPVPACSKHFDKPSARSKVQERAGAATTGHKWILGALLTAFIQYSLCTVALAQDSPNAAPTPAAENEGAPQSGALSPSLISNANPTELRLIENLVAALSRNVATTDAAALRILHLGEDERAQLVLQPNDNFAIMPRLRLTHAAVSPTGALTRIEYQISRERKSPAALFRVLDGTIDLWMQRRADGTLSLTDRSWEVPDDAAAVLVAKANEHWLQHEETRDKTKRNRYITDLVAEYRGGRWIPLRVSFVWEGALLDEAALRNTTENMVANGDIDVHSQSTRVPWDFTPWLRRRMTQFEKDTNKTQPAGTAHFLLQIGPKGWVALDAVWDSNRALNDPKVAQADTTARRERSNVAAQNYTLPEAHRNFGAALFQLGLYEEAVDELQKADALQPGIVGAATLEQVEPWRARDPQRVAFAQIDQERAIGLADEHPLKLIPPLKQEFNTKPTPLSALRLGLEYSRMAFDEDAALKLQQASNMNPESLRNASLDDRAWMKVLADQLRERSNLAHNKPPNIVRSTLFTVRCWSNDLNAVRLLAGLEAAQHTIYADFGIPMSNTEVVLWRNQGEFQKYTGHMTGRQTSEFVTALTMTQLVNTDKGPQVLGEEINFFADPRADTMSTVAHEYGHVGVRQLSRGRLVPDWLNEGIATAVEGGYEDYLQRVRSAAKSRKLLSMAELREWNVDGERAFLAYSQANSMVDYMKARWGNKALLQILSEIGRDTPPEQAVRKVLKLTPDQLWDSWAKEGIK